MLDFHGRFVVYSPIQRSSTTTPLSMLSLRVITRDDAPRSGAAITSLRVITLDRMARRSRRRATPAKGGRRGVPYTVYLSQDMTAALNALSSQRKVDKSDLVRTAIQRLLDDIANGQLDLPLGI
jgi:uncharacterized protein RhaS with RHS repeats